MEFSELISEFAERHNVDNLEAEDDTAFLDIDGIIVSIVSSGDSLIVSAEIGEPPVEGGGTFANILLEANLESEAFFAKSQESGMYIVARRLSLLTLDSDAFDTMLESLVNLAETWRHLLADFRPAAEEKAANDDSQLSPFTGSTFLQV